MIRYELCENVVYLGTTGCFTTEEGLKIAYFSGAHENTPTEKKDFTFSYEQFKSLEVQMKWTDPNYQGTLTRKTSGQGVESC